ncbi:hypothetical protein BUALT_Bualt02G0112100 [Buddleja alternifolia]|uniref:Isopenicillin N synthase-like Fe(2+) 2OG dioxygenase domain-containing protein n=1 Tax=Buddleja alternifolia TaxID=168488 RepID=A0AAV6Y6C3_9LAMI|nr:hypothetical protein BUALT_Bualt02G0112100 [Buddleja alternifolia]
MDSHAQSNKLPIIEFSEKNLIPGTSVFRIVSHGNEHGVVEYCNSLIESSFHMKRLIKYKSQGENETSTGLLPHTDKTFMSIISTNEVKGLQIETPQGEWIDFEPSPSKFILTVGEAFMVRSSNSISPSDTVAF